MAGFEHMLDSIGNCGRAQVIMYLCSVVIESTGGFVVYYFMFEGSNPGFECSNANSSDLNTTWNSECPAGGIECKNLTFSNDFTTVVTEWGLVCGDKYVPRLITSLHFVGMLIGALLGGQLADMYGRKWVLIVSWGLMMASQSFASLAPTWPVYAFMRALAGLFCGAIATVATVIPMEFVGTKWRPFLTIRVGWRIGNHLIIFLAYYIRQWRYLVLASGLFHVPFFVLAIIFMPESSRWLIQKRRYKDALRVLEYVAKLNKKPAPSLEMVMEVGRQNEEKTRYTFLDLFRTKQYTARTLTLMTGWFVSNCTSYAIQSQISADLVGNIYLNVFISAFCNLVAVVAASFLMSCTGRRKFYPMVMTYPVIAMFTILALDLTGYMDGREGLRTGLALSGFAFISTSWQVDFIYCSEAYPTLIRNIATGAGNTAARVGGIIAPQIGLLGNFHPSLPYVIIGILAIVASVLMYTIMPETKGQPLPEGLPPRKRTIPVADDDANMIALTKTESEHL